MAIRVDQLIEDPPKKVWVADMVRWMNAQNAKRPAGAEAVAYHHRSVVAILEEMHVPIYEKTPGKKGTKLYVWSAELREQSPKFAAKMLDEEQPDARAEA